jgi:hypothetical protein
VPQADLFHLIIYVPIDRVGYVGEILIDLEYRDTANKYLQSMALRLRPGDPPFVWSFPLLDPAKRDCRVRYRTVHINGSELISGWEERTLGDIVRIGGEEVPDEFTRVIEEFLSGPR